MEGGEYLPRPRSFWSPLIQKCVECSACAHQRWFPLLLDCCSLFSRRPPPTQPPLSAQPPQVRRPKRPRSGRGVTTARRSSKAELLSVHLLFHAAPANHRRHGVTCDRSNHQPQKNQGAAASERTHAQEQEDHEGGAASSSDQARRNSNQRWYAGQNNGE